VTETSAVNFNCPTKLLDDFDAAWKDTERIPSRTAALLRVMENFVAEHREAQKG